MKLSKILLALAIVALLASNGYQIYQNNRVKTEDDKLQTTVTSLQKSIKATDKDVQNTDSDVQNTDGDVESVCKSLSQCVL